MDKYTNGKKPQSTETDPHVFSTWIYARALAAGQGPDDDTSMGQ